MHRWLVEFRSRASRGRADVTIADVWAPSRLAAIRTVLREVPPHHPWALAEARPWPLGCPDVDAAIVMLA